MRTWVSACSITHLWTVSADCEYICINPDQDGSASAPFVHLFGSASPLHNVFYTASELYGRGGSYSTSTSGTRMVPMLSDKSTGRAYARRRAVQHLYADEQGQQRQFVHIGWHTYFSWHHNGIVLAHLFAASLDKCPPGMRCMGPMPQPE